MLMPALSQAATVKQNGLAHRDAVLVAIALEIDSRQRGTWASELDDLVPDLLPAVPPDRFNGRPIRYVLVDGAPVIYSVSGWAGACNSVATQSDAHISKQNAGQ